jgi:hypothetical protein
MESLSDGSSDTSSTSETSSASTASSARETLSAQQRMAYGYQQMMSLLQAFGDTGGSTASSSVSVAS